MLRSRDEDTGMTLLRAIALTMFLTLATAMPSLGISAFGAPAVVIYPLTLSGAVNNSEVGSDVAILLGTKIGEGGNVIVRPSTPGTARAQYLDAAIKEKADYYVTGYLQQIGSDVSMILQVVSTHSGSVVFSATTTIKTFGDAAAEADPVRVAILRHAGRGLAALDAPPPASAPTAAPTSNQGVNLTRALRRRNKAVASPSPTPSSDAGLVPVSEIQASFASPAAKTSTAVATPSPTPTLAPTPSEIASPQHVVARVGRANDASTSTILVVDTGGTEADVLRARASTSLLSALRRIGVPAARLTVSASVVASSAQSICRANPGAERFYEPTLTLGRNGSGASLAMLAVTSVDCTGAIAAHRDASSVGTSAGGDVSAIDRAAMVVAPQLAGL